MAGKTPTPDSSGNQERPAAGAPDDGPESMSPEFLETAAAPSLPAAMGSTFIRGRRSETDHFAPGDRIEDFEIVALLGRGASGQVYLARQRSLDRRVALKVTRDETGDEARSMAHLEHRHIVQVFFETVDPEHQLRYLCMQYVPGTTMQCVIERLSETDPALLSGRSVLDAVAESGAGSDLVDDDGFAARTLITASSYRSAVCWLVARTAEALAYAHSQNVLHRDIKPANILIDRYGRPRLADFGLALRTSTVQGTAGATAFGGTLPYMAPEHLDALNPAESAGVEQVEARSDVYSLAVVAYELFALRRPFGGIPAGTPVVPSLLKEMAAERRLRSPSLTAANARIPLSIAYAVQRGLEPSLEDRYQSSHEFAEALDGCRELELIRDELPESSDFERRLADRAQTSSIVMAFLPHLLGTTVFAAYGMLRLGPLMSADQSRHFLLLCLAIGLVVYLPILWFVVAHLGRIFRVWRDASNGRDPTAARIDETRSLAVHLPAWSLRISSLAWWFAIAVTALLLYRLNLAYWDRFWDFAVGGVSCWLLATTYNVLAVRYVSLRFIYPQLWASAVGVRDRAREELRTTHVWTRTIQLAAGTIPLVSVLLLLWIGPENFDQSGYTVFRGLTMALVVLGMGGFFLSGTLILRINECADVWTGRHG